MAFLTATPKPVSSDSPERWRIPGERRQLRRRADFSSGRWRQSPRIPRTPAG